ncbi:hypothetical protein EVAR_61931_1 [Eumeta japonica]|uniref:Uncharacterized protein n=1 Tax=Eumeta variegata TaxID=151549 RepID=A0A4C1ZGT6_EUMVA|nr:hypothetical protein EVAR_61931_1 [Eumeta japonica]
MYFGLIHWPQKRFLCYKYLKEILGSPHWTSVEGVRSKPLDLKSNDAAVRQNSLTNTDFQLSEGLIDRSLVSAGSECGQTFSVFAPGAPRSIQDSPRCLCEAPLNILKENNNSNSRYREPQAIIYI